MADSKVIKRKKTVLKELMLTGHKPHTLAKAVFGGSSEQLSTLEQMVGCGLCGLWWVVLRVGWEGS
jgi:hypothetical protein